MTLGNIDSKRDWGHSKDYVYGMWLMLQHDKPDDYVLATGKSMSIRDFVEKCFIKKDIEIKWIGEGLKEVGIDKKTEKIMIKINKNYFRPCDVNFLLGDSTKSRKILGWKQEYTMDTLIDEMFLFNSEK